VSLVLASHHQTQVSHGSDMTTHAPFKDASARVTLEGHARDSMRRVVRDATRNDHRVLDHAMSNSVLGDRVGYGIFLNIHYRALRSLAGQWRTSDQPAFNDLVCCIADDLRALGFPVIRPTPAANVTTTSFCQWGIAYVIRGSRLGAQVLRQRVPASFPTSYLGHVMQLSWPEFLRQLDEAAETLPGERNQIIGGAKSAFAAFIAAVDDSVVAG